MSTVMGQPTGRRLEPADSFRSAILSLREGVSQRDQVFEQCPVGLAIADGSNIIRANPAFCRITGYSAAELRTTALPSIFSEEPLNMPADSNREQNRVHCKQRSGETILVRTSKAPWTDDLVVEGSLIAVDDVSDYYREMEVLRARGMIARIAAEHSSDAIFEWDTRTDALMIHQPARLGLADGAVPATFSEWRRLIHPADVEAVQSAIARHYETRQTAEVRYRMLRPDGSVSMIEARGSAFWNPSGDCSTWIGVVTDITEKLRNEEAQALLAAIVESSNDAIVGCDVDSCIVSWNGGAEHLYGYSFAEVKGQAISMIVPNAEDRVAFTPGGAHAEGYVRRMESIHLTRTGSCAVSVTVSPVFGKDRKPTGFSLIAHDISERKRNERRLEHQARHDALTGLPNRRFLRENLLHALTESARNNLIAGVFYIDVDGFKSINDNLGHMVGDELLRSIAGRLSSCLRRPDSLSRVGGDEFVLIANGLQSERSARILGSRLLSCLRQPYSIGGNQMFIDASIGVSLCPRDCDDAESLLRNADSAMYKAKSGGGNQVQFFNAALADSLRTRREITGSFRPALENSEFDLFFQPVFSAADNRVARFESLLRWRQAPGIQMTPAGFIPISEETGWIVPIGTWVLREACRRAAAWQTGPFKGVGVSVNVSAVQLSRPDFLAVLGSALADSRLEARLLELELTESIFVNNPKEAARTIAAIHNLGVSMALDDFGTGYSSLSYLQNLPMDALKIDRSFLSGIESNPACIALIKSLISLAHSLGMRVVVEGIENRQQYELVKAAGCDELQGYFLGEPHAELTGIDGARLSR